MKATTVVICAAFLSMAPAAHAADPIVNLIDMQVPSKVDGSPRSVEEVGRAIMLGCSSRGWIPATDGEQKIRASILVRGKHFAEVDIPYTATSYSIIYRSSRNLDYNEKKQRIHRKYEGWVRNLHSSIQKQFGAGS